MKISSGNKETIKKFTIIRQFSRYPATGNERFPFYLEVIGTLKQARFLAEMMCGPGCEYEFYVEGEDDV